MKQQINIRIRKDLLERLRKASHGEVYKSNVTAYIESAVEEKLNREK